MIPNSLSKLFPSFVPRFLVYSIFNIFKIIVLFLFIFIFSVKILNWFFSPQYYCGLCKLFDDEDRQQYHCDGCGLCRVGGRDKFFHCDTCEMCLPISIVETHKVSGAYIFLYVFYFMLSFLVSCLLLCFLHAKAFPFLIFTSICYLSNLPSLPMYAVFSAG